MSVQQKEQISFLFNMALKAAWGITAFVLSYFLLEIRTDIKEMTKDISTIKERVARMEGQINIAGK